MGIIEFHFAFYDNGCITAIQLITEMKICVGGME